MTGILYECGTTGSIIENKTQTYNRWPSVNLTIKYYKWGDDDCTTADNELCYWPTTTTTGSLCWYDRQVFTPRKTPQEQLREILRSRMSPAIHRARKALSPAEEREMRARETLRRVVGEGQFQRYLVHGFVTVRHRNGYTYQIFPGHSGVNVWKNGQKIEHWCVLLSGNFPATDQVIMRYLMCVNNPDQLRAKANVSKSTGRMQTTVRAEEMRSLPEIFRLLKQVA